MQFRVTRPLTPSAKTFVMPAGAAFTKYAETDALVTRDFVLTENLDAQGKSLGVRIHDMPLTREKIWPSKSPREVNATTRP